MTLHTLAQHWIAALPSGLKRGERAGNLSAFFWLAAHTPTTWQGGVIASVLGLIFVLAILASRVTFVSLPKREVRFRQKR